METSDRALVLGHVISENHLPKAQARLPSPPGVPGENGFAEGTNGTQEPPNFTVT